MLKVTIWARNVKGWNSLSRAYKISTLGFILVGVGVFVLFNWLNVVSSEDYRQRDLAIFWLNGHALLNGQNPYIRPEWFAATKATNVVFHNPIFLYPPWTAIVLLPLGAMPIGLAALFLLVSSEVCFAGAFWLGRQLLEWQAPALTWLYLLIALAVLSRPLSVLIHNGQLALWLLFPATLAGWWLVKSNNQDFWAGLLVALLLIKPQLAICPALALGVWVVWERRWRVLVGAVTGACGLVMLSLPLGWGSWQGWLEYMGEKTEAVQTCPTIWGAFYQIFGASSHPTVWYAASLVACGLIVAVMAITLWRLHKQGWLNPTLKLLLLLSFGFVGAETIMPYGLVYDQVVLILPFMVGYSLTLIPAITHTKFAKGVRWSLVGAVTLFTQLLWILMVNTHFLNWDVLEPISILVLLCAVCWRLPRASIPQLKPNREHLLTEPYATNAH